MIQRNMRTGASFFLILIFLLGVNVVSAGDEDLAAAEKLMVWQLEALKEKDIKRYTQNGNKAFKENVEAFPMMTFETLAQGKIAKGFRLEYLGSLRRIGGRTYVWKIQIADEKYELL